MTDPWLSGSGSRRNGSCAHDAPPAADGGRIQGQRADQDPARGLVRDERAIFSPGSFWSAMLSRPPAPRQEPAPPRCSPTSGVCATFTFRGGWLPTAWTPKKSANSTTIPKKGRARHDRLAKAYHLRSLSIDNGLYWRAQRWARFIVRLSQGTWRSIQNRLSAGSIPKNIVAGQAAHPGHGRLAS